MTWRLKPLLGAMLLAAFLVAVSVPGCGGGGDKAAGTSNPATPAGQSDPATRGPAEGRPGGR